MAKKLKRGVLLAVSAACGALLLLLVFNLSSGTERLVEEIEPLYAVGSEDFSRSMSRLLGPPLVPGNKVTALHNGDEIFPSMLEAIASAKRTITFEIYIYWKGEIGEAFTEALIERAKAGVTVHLLLDWVGSADIDEHFVERMSEAGIQVERYRPLRWYDLDRINNRTHRRLLVVDGKIGFTGGVGVADEWLGDAEDPEHWRDSHFRVEGPAVGQMQAAFMLNWMKVRPTLLHGDAYFPALERQGDAVAQVFTSAAGTGDESIRLMYMLAIASAEQSIKIANAYFVPDDLAIEHLVSARERGVSVEIVVPGPLTDVPSTRRASRALWEPLLEAGVEICEYEPTMFHTKVMIVDDLFVSVGSTNFDNRSFRLNDEANMNVLDAEFGSGEAAQFAEDKRLAHCVDLEEWRGRPRRERAVEVAASWLRSQL
jgi:cardiolipin synthase